MTTGNKTPSFTPVAAHPGWWAKYRVEGVDDNDPAEFVYEPVAFWLLSQDDNGVPVTDAVPVAALGGELGGYGLMSAPENFLGFVYDPSRTETGMEEPTAT